MSRALSTDVGVEMSRTKAASTLSCRDSAKLWICGLAVIYDIALLAFYPRAGAYGARSHLARTVLLDLDLKSRHIAYHHASLIDLYLHTKFH